MEIRKLTITLIFSLTSYIVSLSQNHNTNYFKLEKIYEYGATYDDVTGGQFIHISNNICYDSDKFGNYIGNGKLFRDTDNNSAKHVYLGTCYHGKAKYIFNGNFSQLTVEINPHYKYIYVRTKAPDNIINSSLIKDVNFNNQNASSLSSEYTNPNTYYESPTYNGSRDENTNTSSPSNQPQAKKKDCVYCNGTGKIERNDNAPPTYGTKKAQQKCAECGKWFSPDIVIHYHQICSHCGGTGKLK